jgi:hypothetical protein
MLRKADRSPFNAALEVADSALGERPRKKIQILPIKMLPSLPVLVVAVSAADPSRWAHLAA